MTQTEQRLAPGQQIRFFSMCGPCIPAEVVKVNRVTCTLKLYGKVEKHMIHTTACPSCTDHEHTQYRDGYMD